MRLVEGLEQGSVEWHLFRSNHIMATDSSVIAGEMIKFGRTPLKLYYEKRTGISEVKDNENMERGRRLEPVARDYFIAQMGFQVKPAVIESSEHTWAAASLDGIDDKRKSIVEIKIHKPELYEKTLNGYIPEYYFPQFQKQLYVSELDYLYYLPFSNDHGHIVKIYRDQEFIKKMIAAEKEFWQRIQNFNPPDTCDKDFKEIIDDYFLSKAQKYLQIKGDLNWLENEMEAIKTELITYAEEENIRCDFLKIQKVIRRGNVDYKYIPELQGIDLEKYRRSPSEYFLIKESI